MAIDYFCKCCHQLFRKVLGGNMKSNMFRYCMRTFVTFLNVCPFYTVNYHMIEYIQNEMDRFIFKFLLNTLIFMALLSYWTASLKTPKKLP